MLIIYACFASLRTSIAAINSQIIARLARGAFVQILWGTGVAMLKMMVAFLAVMVYKDIISGTSNAFSIIA